MLGGTLGAHLERASMPHLTEEHVRSDSKKGQKHVESSSALGLVQNVPKTQRRFNRSASQTTLVRPVTAPLVWPKEGVGEGRHH